MADKIQGYDAPQVRETPLPDARQQSIGTPEFFSGANDANVRLGGAMVNAGTGLAAVAAHMQEKENLAAVTAAEEAYGKAILDYQIEVKQKRTMHGAKGLTGDFSDFHAKTVAEIEKSLQNPAQRQAFTTRARRSGLATRHEMATFEIGETRKAQTATFERGAQNLIDLGAAAATPEAASTHRDSLRASAKAYAAVNNFDEEMTDHLVTNMLTQFHAARIASLARTNGELAQKYFKENEHEIAGSKRDDIGKFVDSAGAETMGVRVGGEIYETIGPKDDKSPIELDKMEEAARKRFENNPQALKATISNIRERVQATEKGREQRFGAIRGAVSQAILDGKTMTEIRRMPQFAALPDKIRLEVNDAVENRQLRQLQRSASYAQIADANESRRERRLHRDAYPEILRLQTNPRELAEMSPDQIRNKVGSWGVEHTREMLALQQRYKNNQAALSEGTLDGDDFKAMARAANYDVEKAKGDDARRLTGIKSRIEREIGLEQQANNGKISRERKLEIAQREFDNMVMVDRTLWMDAERPRGALLTKEERDRAYVDVGGTRVNLRDISEAEEKAIIASLKKKGIPPTMKNIAELWMMKGGQPKRTDELK